MQIQLIKSAEHVNLQKLPKAGQYELTVNDRSVILGRRHPISVSASLTSAEDASLALLNSHFVFENDNLREYRDSSYKGFIQSDEFLERFGTDTSLNSRGFDDFQLSEFGLGGAFNITTGFSWSAFSKNLKTQVSILRQICSNGMVARMPMFEREVPIINLFDHHLDIAAKQLVDISKPYISKRLSKMSREHALVKEVKLVSSHIEKRLEDDKMNKRLNNLHNALFEAGDISEYYTVKSITNNIVQALPSPISRLDLLNITTELNTHSESLVNSTTSSLDRIASGLMFPKMIEGIISERNMAKSTFGNPEQAFFG